MESPGEFLKREREYRGFTLKKVHEDTRVPLKFLEAIESNDYDGLPHQTFTKGFIRSYCRYLGLDETDAALRYDMFMREHAEGAVSTEGQSLDAGKALNGDGAGGRLKLIWVIPVVIFILAGIFAVYSVFIIKKPAPSASQAVAPPVPVEKKPEAIAKGSPLSPAGESKATPEAQAVLKEKAAMAVTPAVATVKKHSLEVTATALVWIQVSIDGAKPIDVVLREGQSASWKAERSFNLVVGNAGGVDVKFDGAKLAALGKPGKVVSLRLPAED